MSWKKGDFYVICPICGFQKYRSDMRMRWDKLLVCKDDWNPRQPQDKIRLKPEKVYTNTGIGEEPEEALSRVNTAWPLTTVSFDGTADYTYGDYFVTANPTADDYGPTIVTANQFTLSSARKGIYFTLSEISTVGESAAITFTDGTSATVDIGFYAECDFFTNAYEGYLGNFLGDSENTPSIIFSDLNYQVGDIMCMAFSSEGDNGTVYFYHKSDYENPISSYALPNPISTNPTAGSAAIWTVADKSITITIIETPEREFTGVTQFATTTPITYLPDEFGL